MLTSAALLLSNVHSSSSGFCSAWTCSFSSAILSHLPSFPFFFFGMLLVVGASMLRCSICNAVKQSIEMLRGGCCGTNGRPTNAAIREAGGGGAHGGCGKK